MPVSISTDLAQWPAVLVELVQKAQADAGGLFADASQQRDSEVLDKALTGPQREGSLELPEVQLVGGAQSGLGVVDELTDALARLERPG